MSKTLFWLPEGPRIRWEDDTLYIENLNPEVATAWRMSRRELFKLGWACLKGAMWGK